MTLTVPNLTPSPRPGDAGPVRVKICGLTTPGAVEAAADAGAAYVGFVFFPPSPRALAPGPAREAALAAPPGVVK
ncbi:MAG: N-(5'-phosphoribosyl)anthranilate isomerase, partial [Pseudomonadota bacterium]